MKLSLDSIIAEIRAERLRQQALPGGGYDLIHSINDYVSVIIYYLPQYVNRKSTEPDQGDYHNNLVSAAAIIIAALEHEDALVSKK